MALADNVKILVVDDTIEIVTITKKLLTNIGYDVITAGDGEEGLEKALQELPDLVVSDVMMPKMDGLEVCRRLKEKEETRLIPVVLLTSKDYVEDKVNGLESGADDYITKPFEAKEFVARIKGMVERRKYRDKVEEEGTLDALEKMLDGVAHEVRNPIVAIGGFARRIRDSLPPGDRIRTYAQHITHEAERLETMLREIISMKSLVISLNEKVDLMKAARSAVEHFGPALEQKMITIREQFAGEDLIVRGDRQNLEVAFSHVIENAIEAMEPGGSLLMEIARQDHRATVDFTDTGRGIPKNELKNVVRPFYTSKMSGAGMGLTRVKHIAIMHGGAMSITSTVGEGTTVRIDLPLVEG